jgi:hypothetical protein
MANRADQRTNTSHCSRAIEKPKNERRKPS